MNNRIATSRATLPVTLAYGVAVCILSDVIGQRLWLQTACLVASVCLMMLLNNKSSLIRVHSRLVSCTFIALTLMAAFLKESVGGNVVQVLFIIFLLIFFSLYQDKAGMGKAFFAFAFIGGISTAFVQMLYFVPFLWLMLGTYLQAATVRTYAATLLGLLTPYWFWAAYCLYVGDYLAIPNHLTGLARFEPLCNGTPEPHLLASLAFVTLLTLCGTVHFIRESYNESIRTRMLYYMLLQLFLLSLLFMIMQPSHSDCLLRIVIVCASPFIAHFFTFSRSKATAILFVLAVILTLLLTAFNQWIS